MSVEYNFLKKHFGAWVLSLLVVFSVVPFFANASVTEENAVFLAQSGKVRLTPTPTTSGDNSVSDDTGGGPSDLCGGANMTVVNGICVPKTCSGGVCSTTRFADLVSRVVLILLTVSGLVAVVLIIIGGFQMILSRGNEESAKKGKQTLTYAVIGLVVVIMSFAIVSIITGTLTSNSFMTGGSTGSGGGGGSNTGNPSLP